MKKVYVIGIGPGSRDYLIPLAEKHIREANVLIGSPRLLSFFSKMKKKKIRLAGNYADVVNYIIRNKDTEKIAVLVSGDPGIFSFSRHITRRLSRDEFEVIPGISSLQLAFSRIGEPWDDVCIVNLHNRSKQGLAEKVAEHKKVFVFTDNKNTPPRIASYLLTKGIRKRTVYVFNNLSHDNEEVIRTNIDTLSRDKKKVPGLCVILIKK